MTEKTIDLEQHRGMTAHDPRRQKLIVAVLDDFERLARE